MSQPSLNQLIKTYQKYRPSCTPSLIQAVTAQMTEPKRWDSPEYRQMRSYLQWRLHISSKQLDQVLLGCFVSVYADELSASADEDGAR